SADVFDRDQNDGHQNQDNPNGDQDFDERESATKMGWRVLHLSKPIVRGVHWLDRAAIADCLSICNKLTTSTAVIVCCGLPRSCKRCPRVFCKACPALRKRKTLCR